MAGYDEVMHAVRTRAQQTIGSNALRLADHGGQGTLLQSYKDAPRYKPQDQYPPYR